MASYPSEQFAGQSRIGNYGDKIMEGDYHVGQVLDTLSRPVAAILGATYISFLQFPAVHQNEFLKSLAGINFPGIEIAARIRN